MLKSRCCLHQLAVSASLEWPPAKPDCNPFAEVWVCKSGVGYYGNTQMNAVIDWGNTRLKVGWFEGDRLVDQERFETADALALSLTRQLPDQIIVSSTNQPADAIRTGLKRLKADFLVLDTQTPVPVQTAYNTPHTLGADRVAAAVGATVLFPGRDCLILDAGTCLTADFVDQNGVFQGGLISPGVRMRFRAMHEQTARLPLIELPPVLTDVDWPAVTAKNTRHALLSGVLNGLLLEMNGLIEHYRREHHDLVVLTCGGDAPTFESRLNSPIFAASDLVLIGLNRILTYNVKNLHADLPDINA